jgi:hypothetical protein
MRKLVAVLAFALISGSLFAQSGFRAGINFGLPVGNAADVTTFSLGLDASYMHTLNDMVEVGFATGFTNAFGDEIGGGIISIEIDDIQFIPVAASGRVNATEKFFAGADIGYAIGVNDGNEGGFYYRPVLGFRLTDQVDASFSYTGISRDGGSFETLTLGIGYRF